MADFAHLHVHTEYSMLDGASRIDGLMRHAAQQGMPAIAMTDHGVMFGAVDFYRAGLQHGVKPILGSEIYMAPGSRFAKGGGNGGATQERYYHLGLLAADQQGYRNLMRLVSRAYLEGYYYKPRADKELLKEHSEGLVCLSGCLGGEVNQLLLKGQYDRAREAAAWYRDVFGPDRYFVELQDHGIPEQDATNPQLIKIAEELGLGLVVTNDSHYTHAEEYEAHDALLCIQTQAQKSDANRFRLHNDQFFVKPADQMHALFPDHPETWKNSLLIAERCDVTLDFDSQHLPRFDCPDGVSEREHLRQKVDAGARQRYGDTLPDAVRQRLEYELGVIERMGFSAYFLIVADLCEYARSVGIRVGPGRGSAAGCAVAYCTRITDLDPLEHGLIFERFLNPERISMPDIDMDFDERRRGEMIRYASEKYGHDHVAQIVTFQTIKAKQAIKDSARLLGYPYGFGDRLCKMFPPAVMGKESTLAEAREKSGELRDAWANEAEATTVLQTAIGLEGLKRQHSIHAAGVVIADEPITEIVPVLRLEADGEIVTQYDGGMVESLGLLKMDFLGLRNLTVISDALDHIKATTGEQIAMEELQLDDEATYALLSAGDTDGVFQLESSGYKALCRVLKPDRFEDITALGALYRPGPMSAGLHTKYAHRKHELERIDYPHDDVIDILEESYGLLIYQEQVQKIAQRIAGFTLGEADLIRKAMGKKLADKMAELKEQFLEGTVAQGYTARLGSDLWGLIEGFASYAFNKSHSAAYGLVTYQTAWLKAHYPVEYMAALLTSVKNHKDRLPAALNSCRQMGITVLVPDVNTSLSDFAPVVYTADDGTRERRREIRFGLSAVRNVGEQVVRDIVAARTSAGAFTGFADFASKVDASCLNRRTVESLVKAGAFESVGHPRLGLLQVFETISEQAIATKKAESEGQFSLFGAVEEATAGALEAIVVPRSEFSKHDKLAAEREMLGLYVSDHPLQGLERALASVASTTVAELIEDPGEVTRGRTPTRTLAGVLTGITKKFTRNGDLYVTATLEDLSGAVDAIFFPLTYQQAAPLLVEDAVLVVGGRLDASDTPKLIASDVSAPDLSEVTGAPLTLTLAPQQCTPHVLQRLRTILCDHTGPVGVHLHLVQPSGRRMHLRLEDSCCVTRSAGLAAELKTLLGPEAVGV